jgi:hypothetical protein
MNSVRELRVLAYGSIEVVEDNAAGGQVMTRAERKKDYFVKIHQLNDKKRRQWLIKHGKGHVLDFHDE